MNTKKVTVGIWCIILVLFLVITIMHPRINFGLILFFSLIQCISIAFSRKVFEKKTLWKKSFLGVADIFILWIFCSPFNVLYPYHATYEYKNDIQNLKSESPQIYSHFPDTIPDSASKVKWVCLSGLLQGSGYEALFFYADDSYLEEIYETYAFNSTLYTYAEEERTWISKDAKKLTYFPEEDEISDDDKKNVSVFILTENSNLNHSHISGFYINQTDGYICFFAE